MIEAKASDWWGLISGIGAALFAIVIGYWWNIVVWLEVFEKLAGWAQFVGAIIAIFGSAFLAAWHHGRVTASQARDQLITFRNLAHIAVRFVEYARVELSPGVHPEKYVKDFEVCKEALDAIEYAKMSTPTLVYTIIEINHHFDRFRANFEPLWPRNRTERDVRNRRMSESFSILMDNINILDSFARSLGAVPGDGNVFHSPNEIRYWKKTSKTSITIDYRM